MQIIHFFHPSFPCMIRFFYAERVWNVQNSLSLFNRIKLKYMLRAPEWSPERTELDVVGKYHYKTSPSLKTPEQSLHNYKYLTEIRNITQVTHFKGSYRNDIVIQPNCDPTMTVQYVCHCCAAPCFRNSYKHWWTHWGGRRSHQPSGSALLDASTRDKTW